MEGDHTTYRLPLLPWRRFLSTPSGWRATCTLTPTYCRKLSYFYPRPPGGGRLTVYPTISWSDEFLSTPSGWRATGRAYIELWCESISIHALRVEGDWDRVAAQMSKSGFLSTPSGWRATPHLSDADIIKAHISIHALRVEGDQQPGRQKTEAYISIHALRVEGDLEPRAEDLPLRKVFLSTPSGWRATAKTDKVFVCFCAKGRRICLFKTRKEKNLPVAF